MSSRNLDSLSSRLPLLNIVNEKHSGSENDGSKQMAPKPVQSRPLIQEISSSSSSNQNISSADMHEEKEGSGSEEEELPPPPGPLEMMKLMKNLEAATDDQSEEEEEELVVDLSSVPPLPPPFALEQRRLEHQERERRQKEEERAKWMEAKKELTEVRLSHAKETAELQKSIYKEKVRQKQKLEERLQSRRMENPQQGGKNASRAQPSQIIHPKNSDEGEGDQFEQSSSHPSESSKSNKEDFQAEANTDHRDDTESSKENLMEVSESSKSRKTVKDLLDTEVNVDSTTESKILKNNSQAKTNTVLKESMGTNAPVQTVLSESEEGPTLMEQMMAAQQAAKKEKTEKKVKEEKRLKKEFGGGFKKGFFNSQKKSKDSSNSKQSKRQKSNKPKNVETVRFKKTTPEEENPLLLPEVQEKLKVAPNMSQGDPNKWATPDLLEKIAQRPNLVRAFADPRFSYILEEMQTNPKAAFEKLQDNPDARQILLELSEILGGHFEQIGSKLENEQQQPPNEPPAAPKGPFFDKAMKAHQDGSAKKMMPQNDEDQAAVDRILSNEELRTILMDPAIQNILVECGDPMKLQQYLKDPEISPKIVKLAEAGLVRVER